MHWIKSMQRMILHSAIQVAYEMSIYRMEVCKQYTDSLYWWNILYLTRLMWMESLTEPVIFRAYSAAKLSCNTHSKYKIAAEF